MIRDLENLTCPFMEPEGIAMKLQTKGDSAVSDSLIVRAAVLGAICGGAVAILWLALT